MFRSIETVYVYLEEDWCRRPTQARHISADVFELLPTDDYDPEDEVWQFVPGSHVRCAVVNQDNATEYGMSADKFKDGKSMILAYELAE